MRSAEREVTVDDIERFAALSGDNFYAHMDDAEAARTLEGLTAAVGFIRSEVAERLHLRRAPELYFQLDRSQTFAARIDELLKRNKKRSR